MQDASRKKMTARTRKVGTDLYENSEYRDVCRLLVYVQIRHSEVALDGFQVSSSGMIVFSQSGRQQDHGQTVARFLENFEIDADDKTRSARICIQHIESRGDTSSDLRLSVVDATKGAIQHSLPCLVATCKRGRERQ
jgi:hypothetical protein